MDNFIYFYCGFMGPIAVLFIRSVLVISSQLLISVNPLQSLIRSIMDLVLVLLCFSVYMLSFTMAQPSPGYYPSSKVTTLSFNQLFRNLWGPGHQSLSQDQTQLTIWLDRSSGSGFKSISSYRSGYFGTSMKLQPGYTAGVIAAFYLSNNEARPGFHDEIDIEFLGTTPGKPYTLQTNVYVKGSGDGNIIGREVKFHLWFDPTADYHKYAILFNPNEIIFFVDDIPIRRYPKKNDATFPTNPMWVYGSIWDASSWATEDGKYKANYQFEPFVAQYTKFAIAGCTSDASPSCQPTPSSPAGGGLNLQQLSAMRWAQSTSLIYDYCKDTRRNLSKNTECFI